MKSIKKILNDYQKKIKKIKKQFIFYMLIFLVAIFTLSSTTFTDRENDLIKENVILYNEIDTLRSYISNELKKLKDNENIIFKNLLSISNDTSYNYKKPYNSIDIDRFTKKQFKTYNIIQKIITNKWDSLSNIPNGLPLFNDNFIRISDEFGYRKHPIHNTWIFHEGIDISAIIGSSIRATSSGVVYDITESDVGYGNKIILNHKYGYSTLYAHLDKFNVNIGDSIIKGDIIGYVGNTGTSTGSHLHYEIRHNDIKLDPSIFIDYNSYLVFK